MNCNDFDGSMTIKVNETSKMYNLPKQISRGSSLSGTYIHGFKRGKSKIIICLNLSVTGCFIIVLM